PRSWPARFGRALALPYPPVFLLPWQVDAPPPAALHGLLFRSSPELAFDDQNISEPVGQRLIWWARPHTGAGRRGNRSGAPSPSCPRKYGAGPELATGLAGIARERHV